MTPAELARLLEIPSVVAAEEDAGLLRLYSDDAGADRLSLRQRTP